MATDQELLATGVAPEAVATLAADRPIFEARQEQAELDKIAPVISEEDATAELDKIAPIIPAPDESAQLDAIAPVVDPLDIFSDEALISDISFSPKEEYIRKGGAAAFDAKTAARLGRIRKGQEKNRTVLGTAAAQVKEIIPQVGRVIKGVGQGIASGLNVFTAPAVAAVTSNEMGVEFSNLVEQQAAESLHGVVAETAGLAKGVGSLGKYISRKTGLSKDWSDMTDEEAFRAIIDEGEKEREVRSMAQGNIPALAPTRERLAEEGFPVRPEKVQEATEHGTLGWLAFGTVLKLGGAGVSKVAGGAVKAALPAIAAGEKVAVAERALGAAKIAEQTAAETLGKTTTATTALGGAEALVESAASAQTLWKAAQSAVTAAEENLARLSAVAKAERGSGLLAAADKAAQLQTLRAAKDAALAAQKAGPKTATTEAALRTAQESFQAAEKAVGESNLAGAIDLISRARSAISSVTETVGQGVIGRPIQAAGAAVEGLAKLVTKTPRIYATAGAIGGLFTHPAAAIAGLAAKELVAPLAQRAGAAVKGYGKAVAEGQARRTLDVLGAAKDVATTSLSQYPLDYAFSIGLSDTDQEARVSAPISTALGVFPGARRGLSRIVTGELITPKGTPTFKPSPAYGENKVLDTTHATAMKTIDAKSAAQINWVRELARKFGGRVYLMPDTATFETTLGEVWKQQHPGAEMTPAIVAQLKQAADQQGMAFGDFTAADGERQPTVFIKNPEAAIHEMGHILEKVLPEQVNARLDEQILARLSPENLEAAGTYYAKRLGRTEPWREVLQRLNPELTPEQYLARELRAENLGVILQNRGEAFATSPGLYRWLAQTVAKIGDVQGIPLAQSESLGFPVFGDVMRASEKAAGKILGDEAGQELIQARDARLQGRESAKIAEQEAAIIAAEQEAAATKAVVAAEAKAVKAKTTSEKAQARQELVQARAEKLRVDTQTKVEASAAKAKTAAAQQELIQARTEKVQAATEREAEKWAKRPETVAEGAAEADKVEVWLRTARIPVASRAAAAQTLAEAMRNQQGVRLSYWGAKGEPGGDPAALRPERRAEIEAQRDAPNADRDLVTKDYFPYGAIITSKGPQFKGWSPNNFNANVARFAEWITANPAAASRIPLAHDLSTEAGQRGLQADLQTFVQNQQAGFTGSGLELVVPKESGATAPVKTGVQPASLPQERADAISYLFNLKLPETPRITAGKIPLNIAGQMVSESTLPGRVSEPIRPRGEFTGPKAEALDIAGESIREVNPFRQAVEQSAKEAGTKPPELIEAAQILALDRIADATVAPELPAFGGNVTTLTAGFLPRERPSIAEAGMEILRMTPDEFIENSSKWPGGFSSEAKKIGLSAKSPEDVKMLRDFQKNVMEKAATAMKAKDYASAMALSNESALFREAIEVATGVGGGADWMRKNVGESYAPPVSESAPVTTQALPKKPKNEFKLLAAGAAGVSKAWVLPGGKVEQLGGQWHHEWLDQNKDVQKKYGLEVPAFEGGDAEAVRESALKKGFARVNYSRNTGTLTVEARAKDWRKQKGAIERLVEENLDDIDNMTVHLLSEDVSKVVDSASERLFNFEDTEKMANLPFITKGEVRGGSQFLPGEDYRRPNVNWEEITKTMFEGGTPEARAQSLKPDYLAAAKAMNAGISPEAWSGLSYSLQKRIRAIAAYRKEHGGGYYEAGGSNIELRGTAKFEDKSFDSELSQIKKGKSGGQTFNADGSVWQSPETPSDIVTLASVNVPREKLTREEFLKAVEPYQELLAQPNVAAGVFAFDQAGKPAASIDINAVVPQSFRDNTLAFAKANDQVAIWDAAKNETVEAGGAGNTKITSPAQMRAAAEALAAGEEFQFLPAEQTGLPGISTGREFDRKAIEGMSQAQLKEYFPEAVIPKKNTEYIPAEIANSPLSKAAGSKEAAVQAFADKLVQFYRQREGTPGLQAGAKWYSEFTPLMKKEFGKDSRIFAELLAATSPNNPPAQNFAFALDALQNWKKGKYDKMISKLNEGLEKLKDGGLEKIYQRDLAAGKVKKPPEKPTAPTYLAHWIEKNDLIPRGSSGKRFSMHSVPVLKVLARKWLELNTGLKTDNFIKNLVGEGDEATIDVWADRTMRRLGYEGFKDRWRILPRNKTGVTDVDFVFSQQAFRKAAEEIGIKPSALQGALWFAEKQYWNEQGWARLDLGDYKTELERMPRLRAGFKSRESLAKAEAKAGQTEQKELEISPRQFQPSREETRTRALETVISGESVYNAPPPDDKKELEILPR